MADEGYFLCWKCGEMREEYGISVKDPPKQRFIKGFCPLCGKREMGYRYSNVKRGRRE